MISILLLPKLFQYHAVLYLFALSIVAAGAQNHERDALFSVLKSQDSLLFNVGYNRCDLKQFEALVSEDFEFYHDKSGATLSKAAFLTSIKEGLCKMNYQARRVLVDGSLQVFPLRKNEAIYGAIQMGRHEFYALEKGRPAYLTSTAQFSHLWLLEKGVWRLAKVLSYDHQVPSSPMLEKH